jgi:hypothetical protein
MNAPTTIRVDESTTERAYRHAITIHCPNEPEMSMAARVDLATLRDQATAATRRATDSAAVILGEIARLAGGAVFSPMPASALIRIKSALDLTMIAARSIDRVTRDG